MPDIIRFGERRFTGWKVDETTGCWLWAGFVNSDGYGRVGLRGKVAYAHRAVYEQKVGPIPDDLMLVNTCGRRHCVNPNHHEVVSRTDHGRRHARTATPEDEARALAFVQRLRDFREDFGVSIPNAAALLDVSGSQLYRWERGRIPSRPSMDAIEDRMEKLRRRLKPVPA